jgi:hypothetical protein
MAKSFTQLVLLAFVMLINSYSYGQKEVHLQINQYIANTPFTIGDTGTNDQGTKFSISRLDYYISSIKLHHDGGMTTNVSYKYIFVTKGKTVDELLGSFNIGILIPSHFQWEWMHYIITAILHCGRLITRLLQNLLKCSGDGRQVIDLWQ